MKLVFDDRALSDLEGIFNWIAKDNPIAAKAVIERIFNSVEHLAKFPQNGPYGARSGLIRMGGAAAAVHCRL